MCPFLSNLKTCHFLSLDLEWAHTSTEKETRIYSFKVLSGFLYMKSEPCLGSFIDSRWNDHKFFPHTRRGLEGPPCHSPLSCSTSFSHCGDTWPLPLISSLSLSLVPFSFGLNRLSRPFSHLSFSISCFPCLCLSVIDTYCIFNLILSSSVPSICPQLDTRAKSLICALTQGLYKWPST